MKQPTLTLEQKTAVKIGMEKITHGDINQAARDYYNILKPYSPEEIKTILGKFEDHRIQPPPPIDQVKDRAWRMYGLGGAPASAITRFGDDVLDNAWAEVIDGLHRSYDHEEVQSWFNHVGIRRVDNRSIKSINQVVVLAVDSKFLSGRAANLVINRINYKYKIVLATALQIAFRQPFLVFIFEEAENE